MALELSGILNAPARNVDAILSAAHDLDVHVSS
jgi:hypothetical protein